LAGHATAIGKKTKKVVGYAVRAKACRVCKLAKRKGVPARKHQCVHTWDGSSKAMEPDMVIQMVKDANAKGVKVSTIVGDEDSTTIARARKEVDRELKKGSDMNHLKKILGNKLYELKKKHKVLSPAVIKYFQKNFATAVRQNKGNELEISKRLRQIVPHAFGDHTQCGEWCGYIQNPQGYRHSHLPKGKDLSGVQLKADLTDVFEEKARQAKKYTHVGSTQANESLNMTVSSKASKRINYSESRSLTYRVEAAVAQKNIGYGYIADVSDHCILSMSSSKVPHPVLDIFGQHAHIISTMNLFP
jgi:hypothetical protein